jgi:esterase/lipase superfamily enzyme
VKAVLAALKRQRPEWKKLKKGQVGEALIRARQMAEEEEASTEEEEEAMFRCRIFMGSVMHGELSENDLAPLDIPNPPRQRVLDILEIFGHHMLELNEGLQELKRELQERMCQMEDEMRYRMRQQQEEMRCAAALCMGAAAAVLAAVAAVAAVATAAVVVTCAVRTSYESTRSVPRTNVDANPIAKGDGVLRTVFYCTTRIPCSTSFDFRGQAKPGEQEAHYGKVQVWIPDNRKPGDPANKTPWEKCFDGGEITATYFAQFADVRAFGLDARKYLVGTNSSDILLFVHGFNNKFWGSALTAAQLAHDAGFKGMVCTFSWPSSENYGRDETCVLSQEEPLREYMLQLETLAQNRGGSLHVLAHSMGSRCTIAAAAGVPTKPGFGQMIFAAADLDQSVFLQKISVVEKRFDRVTVYFHGGDWALAASKIWHGGKDSRLGAEPPKCSGDTIDCITVQGGLGIHHGYFNGNAKVMRDISLCLSTPKLPARHRDNIRPKPWSISSRGFSDHLELF